MKEVLFGLPQSAVEQIRSVFSAHSSVETVIVYGSRAKRTAGASSDIDLTILGKTELAELFQIETELDDLLIPYKIDLSLFAKIDNSMLLDHIERVGQIFFARV